MDFYNFYWPLRIEPLPYVLELLSYISYIWNSFPHLYSLGEWHNPLAIEAKTARCLLSQCPLPPGLRKRSICSQSNAQSWSFHQELRNEQRQWSIITNRSGDGDSNVQFLVSAVATMPMVASSCRAIVSVPAASTPLGWQQKTSSQHWFCAIILVEVLTAQPQTWLSSCPSNSLRQPMSMQCK